MSDSTRLGSGASGQHPRARLHAGSEAASGILAGTQRGSAPVPITRSEFEIMYAARSGLSAAELFGGEHPELVALPCACEDELCKGWAAVDNVRSLIKAHYVLRAPTPEPPGSLP